MTFKTLAALRRMRAIAVTPIHRADRTNAAGHTTAWYLRRRRVAPVQYLSCVVALVLVGAAPALAAEDEQSYSGASDATAASVTEEHFGSILDAAGDLGPDLKAGERVLKYQGDNTAIITDGEDRSVFQSTIPLRAVDDDGHKREVSLDLEDHNGYLASENALANVRIGDTLADGLLFPDIGVTIRPMGVDAGTVGDAGDGRVFYPNASEAADLDFIVAPTATGAETFDVLRSADSPERLRYAVTLPQGAQLIRDPNGPGGLQIVRDGKVLLSIAPVSAVDADHKPVTGSYELTDEGFAINVAHRGADVRYPILVDPYLILNQYYFDTNSGIYYKGWAYSQMGNWQTLNAVYQGNGYRAMQIWNPINYWIGNGFWGKFSFIVPSGAWISMANLGHYAMFSNNTNACATSGLFDAAGVGWITGAYNQVCGPVPFADYGFTAPAGTKPKELAAQWSANGNVFHTQTQLLYVGGAAVRVEDATAPSITSVTGLGTSGQWTKTAPNTATITAADSGTGVQSITATKTVNGTSTALTPVSTCNTADTTNPLVPYLWCPTPTSASISLGTVPEGVSSWTFTSKDLLNNDSLPTTAQVKLDASKPVIALSGSLYDNRNQTLAANTQYTLAVNATDGSASSPATARSGVASVTVLVDDNEIDNNAQSCAAGSCSMSRSVQINASTLTPGAHTVEVWATDQLGQEARQEFTVLTACCTTPTSTVSSGTTSDPQDRAFGDVDGDGDEDMVSRNVSTGTVSVSTSDGTAFATTAGNWGTWAPSLDLQIADVDGDGDEDLVGRSSTTGKVSVGLSQSTSFSSASEWATTNSQDDLYFADIAGVITDLPQFDPQNADQGADSQVGPFGAVSLITRNRSSGAVNVSTPTGQGWDTPETLVAVPAAPAIEFSDVDGDGAEDLVTIDQTTSQVEVRISDAGSFANPQSWGQAATNSDIAFGDVDGDGPADMVMRNRTSNAVTYAPSDGSSFQSTQPLGSLTGQRLVLADLRGLGNMDVLSTPVSQLSAEIKALLPKINATLGSLPDYTPDPTIDYDTSDAQPQVGGSSTRAAAAPSMQLMWQDDGELASGVAARVDKTIQRIEESGATAVRLLVLWGRFSASSTYYDATIAKLRAKNIDIYMTLTGADYDTLPGSTRKTSFFLPGGSDSFSGSSVVNPTEWGKFIKAAVSHYTTLGVKKYAMWNEPNLKRFLELRCADPNKSQGRHTYDLYRELYNVGRAQAIAAAAGTRVYSGEFAEQTATGRPTCSGGKTTRTRRSVRAYLRDVANTGGAPLTTSGVAWHPYQHYSRPSSKSFKHGTGIGNIAALQGTIDALYKEGKLRTGDLKRPGLYLTEFGYFNRPLISKASVSSFHTETEKASWSASALGIANRNRAKSFVFYETAEDPIVIDPDGSGPLEPRFALRDTDRTRVSFDTGVMAGDLPDLNPSNGASELGDIAGFRDYGKGPANSPNVNTPQERKTYCRIWQWARDAALSVIENECPQDI